MVNVRKLLKLPPSQTRNSKRFSRSVGGNIVVTDNQGLRVNAKSVLGMLYALEFEELWCESDKDIYSKIEHYIIID